MHGCLGRLQADEQVPNIRTEHNACNHETAKKRLSVLVSGAARLHSLRWSMTCVERCLHSLGGSDCFYLPQEDFDEEGDEEFEEARADGGS